MSRLPNSVPKPKKRAKALKRGTLTRSTKRLKRTTRMTQRNAKRGGHMFPKNVDEARRAFIRSLPCILAGRSYYGRSEQVRHICMGAVRACHLKSRGSGGKDIGNMWPGCDGAHAEQHRIGATAFDERWNTSLAWECMRQEAEFLAVSA